MTDEKRKGVSLNPDDFVQGGLIDDVDVVLTGLSFARWDYQGQSDPVCALKVEFQTAEGEAHEQYYSAGSLDRLVPSDDGKEAIPVGGSSALVVKSNASQFILSLANSGFPRNKIGSDISVFAGAGVHVRRVAQEARPGLKQEVKEGRERTVLLVDKILWLPGEPAKFKASAKTGSKTQAAPAPAKAAAPAAPSSVGGAAPNTAEIEEKTAAHLIGILSAAGGTIQKAQLPALLFKACTEAGEGAAQPKILSQAFKTEWLASPDRPWKFDTASGLLTLG